MPNLNHTGPEGKGPKSGRKLGKCHKTEFEMIGNLGQGQGLKHLSQNSCGNGKRNRIKYYLTNSNQEK